mgnify:CR=1 FL=1
MRRSGRDRRGRLRPGCWLLERLADRRRRAGRSRGRTRRGFDGSSRPTLPDLREEDIAGSGFAITGYRCTRVSEGTRAWPGSGHGSAERGLRLMLDFVPNHTALDHPWVRSHLRTSTFAASEGDLAARAGRTVTWVAAGSGRVLLAHGRDPYFPGWPDTLQLDYCRSARRAHAMIESWLAHRRRAATACAATWRCWSCPRSSSGRGAAARCRSGRPRSRRVLETGTRASGCMAEVYWDLEWTMLQQGFDYAYDKRLYDRLSRRARAGRCASISRHRAGLPGEARPLPGEPRRAARRGDLPARPARGRRDHRLPHAGLAVSSTRASSRGRRVHLSPHLVRHTRRTGGPSTSSGFHRGCWRSLRDPAFRDGRPGGSCPARPPGMATRATSRSSRLPGRRRASAWHWSW